MDQQKLVSNQEMTDMQAQHERLAIKISQLETKAGTYVKMIGNVEN